MITLTGQAGDGTTIGHARIALSGTPMENNRVELATPMHFGEDLGQSRGREGVRISFYDPFAFDMPEETNTTLAPTRICGRGLGNTRDMR